MAADRPHPAAPVTRDGVRVRHRHTRRVGRISPDPAPLGSVRVLFDGDRESRAVPAKAVEYLDGRGTAPELDP